MQSASEAARWLITFLSTYTDREFITFLAEQCLPLCRRKWLVAHATFALLEVAGLRGATCHPKGAGGLADEKDIHTITNYLASIKCGNYESCGDDIAEIQDAVAERSFPLPVVEETRKLLKVLAVVLIQCDQIQILSPRPRSGCDVDASSPAHC